MEVTRYQFSRTTNSSEERVLAHFSNVLLVLDEMPNFPEELQGEKKGVLYLTQYKIIFQHKDKGSTTVRFPLQLLGDCALGEQASSKQQYVKGTITSNQGVLTFKFIFLYGASDCLNMIKNLSSADMLREASNLQEYPTASIYTYAYPSAPRAPRLFNPLPRWPPPYPGPPELPPPYSEVELTNSRESQEGCCRCRTQRTHEQTDRQD
ncbi:WW domain-binding protein 2 isoform X1 [Alligator mississippiensis]|uniref:WW domain-binding protein 2-like n=2 Tax=Alligator mississippiensis TaxID=8496 RepID=A0A151N6Q4_ALLMI|nr:WW domain-binding protein 2 isoform X1 [Alligator mississippiensis]KYO32478.1 WW domain-binding protein 2-like [Alligator mississippiensis]